MPFNGSGIFQRVRNWVADATAGIKIRADYHDAEDDGFAAGITNCIAKDGQSIITQNIPWNSKRITGLADPVNPQDAATMAYADTKFSKTGDLDVVGKISAFGYKVRRGLAGPYGTNFFNFDWKVGNIEAWIDDTFVGNIATQAYVNAGDATRLPIAGGTITGGLTVNGPLLAVYSNALYFGSLASGSYIQWGGGSTYYLGGGGYIWHSGNFNPAANNIGAVVNGRLVYAGDHNHTTEGMSEPFGGAVITGAGYPEAYPHGTLIMRFRYMQLYTTGWFTCGYA